jgi:hypothetical protein
MRETNETAGTDAGSEVQQPPAAAVEAATTTLVQSTRARAGRSGSPHLCGAPLVGRPGTCETTVGGAGRRCVFHDEQQRDKAAAARASGGRRTQALVAAGKYGVDLDTPDMGNAAELERVLAAVVVGVASGKMSSSAGDTIVRAVNAARELAQAKLDRAIAELQKQVEAALEAQRGR